MGRMRAVGIVACGLVGLGVVSIGGSYAWAVSAVRSKLATPYDVHRVDFPIPFPLTDTERAELSDPTPDPMEVARDRAVARGKHLVEARYACGACHGDDLAGGVMLDDPMIGTLLGPNLTSGHGSRTRDYTAADWDRMVRHGVKPDGSASPMPSKDFFAMSDRELSDIVTYIASLPPVDNDVPPVAFGPIGNLLVASGQFELAADVHPTGHTIEHAVDPPPAAPEATFGRHIALACSGCHRSDFVGGPIVGGPPDWPPAANLTTLGSWSYDQFSVAMREGRRPDGTPLRAPMSDIPKAAANMTEVELQAMWAYFQSLPPAATGL